MGGLQCNQPFFTAVVGIAATTCVIYVVIFKSFSWPPGSFLAASPSQWVQPADLYTVNRIFDVPDRNGQGNLDSSYSNSNNNNTMTTLYQSWNTSTTVSDDQFQLVTDVVGHGSGLVPRESKENFTIVILTYNRVEDLRGTIAHLDNLEYLDKVVVVWNTPTGATDSPLLLPKIHAPIQMYFSERNSLNNRFLPFDFIETEAVFSLDDDIRLPHQEIQLAFRVWRENRNRIVGFPGRGIRFNSEQNIWEYDTGSCMLTFVLTGAAFLHRIYLVKYTFEMPSAIREKVDSLLNCEDIAMNFLVSHLSKRPPIQVTDRTDLVCKDCTNSPSHELSKQKEHYQERTECVNFFAKVYGYLPLYVSQLAIVKHREKQQCRSFVY